MGAEMAVKQNGTECKQPVDNGALKRRKEKDDCGRIEYDGKYGGKGKGGASGEDKPPGGYTELKKRDGERKKGMKRCRLLRFVFIKVQ